MSSKFTFCLSTGFTTKKKHQLLLCSIPVSVKGHLLQNLNSFFYKKLGLFNVTQCKEYIFEDQLKNKFVDIYLEIAFCFKVNSIQLF